MVDGHNKQKSVAKNKKKQSCSLAIIHILATYNNTIITATDYSGAVLCWSSASRAGFRGSKKSTPYAAGVAASQVMEQLRSFSVQEVEVRLKGPGSGRDSAVRAISVAPVEILLIRDVTPVPHNGCRQKKQRRV